jgi:8-amino-7-oxononanoate synthase
VFGRGGRGVADEQKALERIDIFVGTLSKSLGSQGGFVATKKRLIEFLTTRTRSFIYTTALAPANVGAGLAALRLLPSLDDRRAVVRSGAADLIEALRALGCRVLPTSSQIVPVWTGDVAVTKKMSDYLFQRGFFVPSIRPPTVPVGEGRVRLSVTYDAAQRGFGPLLTAFENYLVQTH